MDTNMLAYIAFGLASFACIVVVFMKLKRRQDEIKALIEERFGADEILLRAKGFLVAQQSRGLSQSQGVGDLILTHGELFFAVPLPKLVVIVPLQRVRDLERVRRMGAKSTVRTMLKINYIDDQGEPDALGIRVKEMDRWESAIHKLQARFSSNATRHPL